MLDAFGRPGGKGGKSLRDLVLGLGRILPSRLREGIEGWACRDRSGPLPARPLAPSRKREGGGDLRRDPRQLVAVVEVDAAAIAAHRLVEILGQRDARVAG